MKQLLTIAIAIAILALPVAVNAGVALSSHDLVTNSPSVGSGALTDVNVCTSCHLPHNAEAGADKLWAQAVGGSGGIGGLCESCHDGTVAAVQITTGSLPFSGNAVHANTQDMATCSGSASSCHDVHNQNGSTDDVGKFLTTAAASDNGACVDCHDGSFPGAALTDKTGVDNHALVGAGNGCNCHVIAVVHGNPIATAVAQSGGVESSPASYLLPVDNNTANAYGAACIGCHEGTEAAYSGIAAALHTPGVGTFANATTDQSTGRHLTSGAGLAKHSETMGGCDDCHYMHGNGGTANNMNQKTDNVDSDYCQSCHSSAAGPDFGGPDSHPVDQAPTFSFAATYPLSNVINDAGTGNDYGSANAHIVCETCHSVHRNGVTSTPFLRSANTNDALCQACHVDN